MTSRIEAGWIMADEVARMTVKKNKMPLSQATDTDFTKKTDLFGKGKTIEEIIMDRNIKPIVEDSDFDRIFGGYKEWFDVDAFLKESHKSWK